MSDDIDNFDFFEEKEIPIVSAFRDRERVGFARGMATVIEGQGYLAQYLNKINRMDPELKALAMLEGFYHEVYPVYGRFGAMDLDNIINIFNRTEHKLYKNPVLFILGYILFHSESKNRIHLDIIKNIMSRTKIEGVSLSDVIRYYKLIKRLL